MNVSFACLSFLCSSKDRSDLGTLSELRVGCTPDRISRLLSALSNCGVREIAVIEKCNAEILLVACDEATELDYLEHRLKTVWNEITEYRRVDVTPRMAFSANDEAFQYIAETAVGIHSLVMGDNQVYSQVIKGIQDSIIVQESTPVLHELLDWISLVAAEVRDKTTLNCGLLSAERIAADVVSDHIRASGGRALVVGLGQAGTLTVKVLRENEVDVVVTDRTAGVVTAVSQKYDCSQIAWDAADVCCSHSAIVLALTACDDTRNFAQQLLKEFEQSTCGAGLIVDLSSPPLVDWQQAHIGTCKVLTLVDISRISKRNLKNREKDLTRAKQIVGGMISQIKTAITNSMVRNSLAPQAFNPAIIADKVYLYLARHEVLQAVRELLIRERFVEISTPYVVGVSTDPPQVDKGRAYKVIWPGDNAVLRQSNQLYKQMVVAAGIPRVFEIGPFWRREDHQTHCHLDETIGLDVEVANPGELIYLQELAYGLLRAAANVQGLASIVDTPRLCLPEFREVPVYTYRQAVDLLRKNNYPIKLGEDFGVKGNSRIGWIAKKLTGYDAVFVTDFPTSMKKFYTKLCHNGDSTATFDLIVTGWELASGAMRELDRNSITRRMLLQGVSPERYGFYLDMIAKAPAHGGFGMGFDRLMSRLLGHDDIRESTVFPRTAEIVVP